MKKSIITIEAINKAIQEKYDEDCEIYESKGKFWATNDGGEISIKLDVKKVTDFTIKGWIKIFDKAIKDINEQ